MNFLHGFTFVIVMTTLFTVPAVFLMRSVIRQRERQRGSMLDIESAICRKK